MSRSVSELLGHATETLRSAGIPGAAQDARILLSRAIGCDRVALAGRLERQLSPVEARTFGEFVSQRCARRPVSQIIGHREFWGREFRVSSDVLDPRPETETIIAEALSGPRPRRILDLGTGSGCLAATLLAEFPNARAVAVDVSRTALEVARENAARLGVIDRLDLIWSDWFAEVGGQFDLVVSNPPYVSESEHAALGADVRLWEPPLALLAGKDGLDAYRAIATGLRDHLAPAGTALLEVGHNQSGPVVGIFRAAGFPSVHASKDMDGRDRIVKIVQ
ncbi:MAG: peptide chain release factor N(5)-glutamine methyltransferase [Paracoccaceae bacterium]